MHTKISVFSLPKAGSSSLECEDAWFVDPDPASSTQRFAIADGATDSVFSGMWARILVDAYGQNMLDGYDAYDFFDLLAEAQAVWKGKVDKRGELPWYIEEKAKKGAFSTILRLALFENGTWESFAIGDSCLFQVRDEAIIERFPLLESSWFNSSPYLLSSQPSSNKGLFRKISISSGHWLPSDTFYLMTDAVACWFMSADEKKFCPCQITQDLSQKAFVSLIDMLRHANLMRNDDSTLIRIDLADN